MNYLVLDTILELRIKIFTHELLAVDSCDNLFLTCGWYECEIWDMFGVFFLNHSNLKRILTDYGFEGYKIPHYCYHKKLSIAGNCRMCLVELKNSPKPIVSCAMSARTCLPNSEVYTNSPLVKKARERSDDES